VRCEECRTDRAEDPRGHKLGCYTGRKLWGVVEDLMLLHGWSMKFARSVVRRRCRREALALALDALALQLFHLLIGGVALDAHYRAKKEVEEDLECRALHAECRDVVGGCWDPCCIKARAA